MSYPVFYVPAGDVLPIFFDSFDGGTGASITMSGLAVTDIEIFKDGSTTQRASDAGYTLLDTDGIDFDSLTGIHGFSIDTGDNTDASFYTVGAWFTVVVSAVTIDAQTVNFIAAQFRIMKAEGIAGVPKADVDAWLGTAAATPTVAGVPEVDITHIGGTAVTAAAGIPEVKVASLATGSITAGVIAADAIGASELAADAVAEIADAIWDEDATAHQTQGTFGQAIGDPAADTNTIYGAVVTGATGATIAADIITIDDLLDTEIGALTTAVADLPTNAELATALGTADDAVLAAIAALNNLSSSAAATAVLTTQMTEAYAADGAAPTLAQALHLIIAVLTEMTYSGTTGTAKKLDGSTTAATFTLDDGTNPTSITRAT